MSNGLLVPYSTTDYSLELLPLTRIVNGQSGARGSTRTSVLMSSPVNLPKIRSAHDQAKAVIHLFPHGSKKWNSFSNNPSPNIPIDYVSEEFHLASCDIQSLFVA